MSIRLQTVSLICLMGLINSTSLMIAQDQAKGRKEADKQEHKVSKTKYADESFVYKTIGNRKLELHVTRPNDWKPSDKRPTVLFFHGGGWTGGAPGQFDEHSKYFSSRGMVAIQVQYRLLSRPAKKPKNQIEKSAETKPTIEPDNTPTICIRDAKSALRWVRSNATKLGIDPKRIASAGGSAGGHLAAFLGTTDGTDDPQDDLTISARSNAMLLFNPVYDNGPGGWGSKRVGNRFQEFSPAHNISADDAPAIVFLGTEDKLIPVATAKSFQAKMKSAGLKSELRLCEGAGHGFFNYSNLKGKWYRLTVNEADKFLVELGWLSGTATIN